MPFIQKDTALLHSPKMQEDYLWWCHELETEPHFTSVNGLGSPEFIKGKAHGKAMTPAQIFGKNLTWQEKIPVELVQRIHSASKENLVSPQIYYMLALRSYLAYYCRTDDVLFHATVTRRGDYESKHCGLSIANILPFRSIVSGDEICSEVLKKLKRIQMQGYRHSTTDLNNTTQILRKQHHLLPMHTYESVWFTYQPYYDYAGTELKFRARPIHNGIAATPLYIYLMPADSSGDLWAEYSYCADYVRKESLERLHGFMLRFLDAAVSHPDETIASLSAIAAAECNLCDRHD